jgi:hypothetical protein
MKDCKFRKRFIFLLDVNECLNADLNTCQQKCTNTDGGFFCECNEGYKKDSNDATKCVGEYDYVIWHVAVIMNMLYDM